MNESNVIYFEQTMGMTSTEVTAGDMEAMVGIQDMVVMEAFQATEDLEVIQDMEGLVHMVVMEDFSKY